MIALAENGDPKAQLMLGRLAWGQKGDFDKAVQYFKEASVKGYTISLGELGGIYSAMSRKFEGEGDTGKSRSYMKQAQAWWQVGVIRGDAPLYASRKQYEPKDGFSEQELQEILGMAQTYYSELGNARNDQGLSEFNNEVPAALEAIYGHLIEQKP